LIYFIFHSKFLDFSPIFCLFIQIKINFFYLDCFDKISKIDGYCNIHDLIAEIRKIKRFEFLAEAPARSKAHSSQLNNETLREILYRIEKESDEYIDYDEFLEFFTKRGRPKFMLIFNPIERSQILQKKLDFFFKKTHENSPKKCFSPRLKERIFSQESQKREKAFKSSGKNRINSQESGHYRVNSQESEKIRMNSQESYKDRANSLGKLRLNSSKSERFQESGKFPMNSEESPQRKRDHPSEIRLISHESERTPHEDIVTKRMKSNSPIRRLSLNEQSPLFRKKQPQRIEYNDEKKITNQEKIRNIDGKKQRTIDSIDRNQEAIRIIDGYDSDPEYNTREDHKKTVKNLNLSFSDKRNLNQKTENGKKTIKITVPQPFLFDEREKQKKTRELSKERLKSKEKTSTFKANPVPEFVKQRNLLEQINKEQEKRREEIKKNSRIITMQREKPFSFYLREKENKEIRKKNRFERKEFQFKANPVPWSCTIKLFQRMNEEERTKREERVSKQAQMSLNNAKLPPRMEKHEQEKVI